MGYRDYLTRVSREASADQVERVLKQHGDYLHDESTWAEARFPSYGPDEFPTVLAVYGPHAREHLDLLTEVFSREYGAEVVYVDFIDEALQRRTARSA